MFCVLYYLPREILVHWSTGSSEADLVLGEALRSLEKHVPGGGMQLNVEM